MLKFKNTKTIPANKLFYNRYPYKVIVEGNNWNHDAVRLSELNDLLRQQDDWWDKQSVQRDKLSLYLKKQSVVEEVEHFFSDMIYEIHCPYSNAVLEAMRQGTYDVRENLYYNKYRYRIELGSQWKRSSTFSKIENVMRNLHREDTRLNSSKSGWTHILYTNAKHDLVKLKLTSSKDTIIKYQECKLYTEI